MKKKALILSTLILSFVMTLFLSSGIVAAAETTPQFSLFSVTYLDIDNNRVELDNGDLEKAYRKGIVLTYSLVQPKYRYEIYTKIGSHFSLLRSSQVSNAEDNKAAISIAENGEIKIVFFQLNEHETEQGSLFTIVLSDNQKPYDIDLDTEELDKYHIAPFNLRYRVLRDADSEIDFAASYYKIIDTNGTEILPKTPLFESYEDRYINGINGNCIINFVLFDKAGNLTEKNYTYSKHGVPDSDIPTVVISPQYGFARSVKVSISWGTQYDSNPYAPKYYSLATSEGTALKTQYSSAFNVTREDSTLVVYYFQNGVEHSKSVTINNIDATAPNQKSMQESLNVSINIMEQYPVRISATVFDNKSGIKRVYLSSGEDLTASGKDLYTVNISQLFNFTIYAEDMAGNIAQYGYHLATDFDNATLREYNKKFLDLKKDDYGKAGWQKVVTNFSDLGMYLLTENPSSSQIAQKRRAIDAAIAGDIVITTVISSLPDGLDTMSFGVPAGATTLKKGESAKIIISRVPKTTEYIDLIRAQVFELTGFKNPILYNLQLELVDSEGNKVKIIGDISIKIAMPKDIQSAKVYTYNANNALVEGAVTVVEGNILFSSTKLGEIYIVGENSPPKKQVGLTIGDKFYSWQMLTITASIIVGVALVGSLIVILLYKSKQK